MSPLITRRSDSTNKTYVFQSAAAPNAYWVELSDLNLAPGSGQRAEGSGQRAAGRGHRAAGSGQRIVDAYAVSLAGDVTHRLNQLASRQRPGSTSGGWACSVPATRAAEGRQGAFGMAGIGAHSRCQAALEIRVFPSSPSAHGFHSGCTIFLEAKIHGVRIHPDGMKTRTKGDF
jgi:hypothetical protein